MNFNVSLFNAINGLAHKSIALDNIMIVLSKYVPEIFMAVLALFYFWGVLKGNEKARGVFADTFALTLINLILSYFIGLIYYVPRPFVHNKVNLLFPHIADASFPSDHAIGTMSIAVGLNKYNKILGIISILFSVLVGISRVYVGHHFPLDVIGAYALVFIVNYIYDKLAKNKLQAIYFKIEEYICRYLPMNKINN